VLVSSTVKVPGQSPFAIDWQVSDRSGSVKLFNIYIEGVSMLATGRSEVGAMLEANGGSIDKLNAFLRSKT
jgi:phospholipid transport system substrate-binding protein